jgi:hypothetical protein
MAVDRLREAYFNLLWDRVVESEYPSPELMDRVESLLQDEELAEEYVSMLLARVRGMAPSPQLLNRIERMLRRLELHQQLTS